MKKHWNNINNCEIQLMLTGSSNCVIEYNAPADQETIFEITDTKVFVSVVTVSIQDNAKQLQQLKIRIQTHNFL